MSLLYEVKQVVEKNFWDSVKVVVAEKPNWLILKDKKIDKTFGCIRLNKRSFITLYIDTKQNRNLSEIFDIPKFDHVSIQSRLTGNFYQNKFKFSEPSDMKLAIEAIRKCVEKNYIKTEDKIRS